MASSARCSQMSRSAQRLTAVEPSAPENFTRTCGVGRPSSRAGGRELGKLPGRAGAGDPQVQGVEDVIVRLLVARQQGSGIERK
jgi:hypothetical protein